MHTRSNSQFRNYDCEFSQKFWLIRTSFTLFVSFLLCFLCQKQNLIGWNCFRNSGFEVLQFVVGFGEQDSSFKSAKLDFLLYKAKSLKQNIAGSVKLFRFLTFPYLSCRNVKLKKISVPTKLPWSLSIFFSASNLASLEAHWAPKKILKNNIIFILKILLEMKTNIMLPCMALTTCFFINSKMTVTWKK